MLKNDDKSGIHESLRAGWPHLWEMQRTNDLCAELGYVAVEDLLEAIRRHKHDGAITGRGEPVGALPPTVAHLEAKLTEITAERIRRRLEEDQRRRDQEGNRTYQELLGQRQSTTECGRFWCGQIRLQTERAAEIRGALERRYGLDYHEQAHTLLLVRVLNKAKDAGWEEDPTVYECGPHGDQLPQIKVGLLPLDRVLPLADEIAESMGIARRQGVAA